MNRSNTKPGGVQHGLSLESRIKTNPQAMPQFSSSTKNEKYFDVHPTKGYGSQLWLYRTYNWDVYTVCIFIYVRSHHLLCGKKIRVISAEMDPKKALPKAGLSCPPCHLCSTAVQQQCPGRVQAALNPDAPSIASGNLTLCC